MRLEISNRTDIALRALRTLDGRTEPTPRRDLAEELGTTEGYLPQALSRLVDAGFILSKPGPSGGYLPGAEARKISICQVIESLEGPIDDGVCVLRNSSCNADDPCSLHVPWTQARSALVSELRTSFVIE